MLVLGIESTCDETAAAVVRDGYEILSNVVSSQADLHEIFGGVVPELACRRHIEMIIPVITEALEAASVSLDDLDAIAVAQGPGLIGALLIGINTAKSLSLTLKKPLVAVNHVEAHLYAALMSHDPDNLPPFPHLGVVISGGHTMLLKIEAIGQYKLLGQTIDDAIGEAFDKVAKILGLPYPGGPQVERLAKEGQGDPMSYPFRGGRVKEKPLHFSFSGLKTAVLYGARGQNADPKKALELSESTKADIAASFQRAAFDDLIKKILIAAEQENCSTLTFGGGVTNNQMLRQLMKERAPNFHQLWPTPELTLDNAAMIAGLGYHIYKLNGASPIDFNAQTRMPLGT